ncbi:hypothetical protein OH492_11535 [Vibrio chagasii]|nr:hypothetical protein [Vibrio chagasii]
MARLRTAPKYTFEENISYVSKTTTKHFGTTTHTKSPLVLVQPERARMQSVSLSTVMLGQGIPFIHMEFFRNCCAPKILLRRDSYDSGDWYNRVLFDGSALTERQLTS